MRPKFDDEPRSRRRDQPLSEGHVAVPGARDADPGLRLEQRVERELANPSRAPAGSPAPLSDPIRKSPWRNRARVNSFAAVASPRSGSPRPASGQDSAVSSCSS